MATISIDGYDTHEVGSTQCGECWDGFPRPCEKDGCTGMVHAVFGDEDSDCNYWLAKKCDTCGES